MTNSLSFKSCNSNSFAAKDAGLNMVFTVKLTIKRDYDRMFVLTRVSKLSGEITRHLTKTSRFNVCMIIIEQVHCRNPKKSAGWKKNN